MSTNIEIARICEFCKNEFTAKTTKTRYCSHSCNSRGYKVLAKLAKLSASNGETERARKPDLDNAKQQEFLSINQAALLFGISRRTIYRIITRGELDIAKFGARTIVRRCDMDSFFALPVVDVLPVRQQKFPGSEYCYTISQVQQKFGISPAALYHLINRHGINKYSIGKFTYVPKQDINAIFNDIEL